MFTTAFEISDEVMVNGIVKINCDFVKHTVYSLVNISTSEIAVYYFTVKLHRSILGLVIHISYTFCDFRNNKKDNKLSVP